MKTISLTILTLILFTGFDVPPHQATYQYINGQWFNGRTFEKKNMFSVNGVFRDAAHGKIDSVIDLQNKFVVPPFCEAHTHHLEGIGDIDERINGYLRDGVFYVKNPNNVLLWTKNLFPKINNPHSLDASFANAGLTSTEGHPMRLYEDHLRPQIAQYIDNAPRGWFNNKSYYTIDSEKDFAEKWDLIKAGKPNFIKVYLSNSEDFGKTPAASPHPLRTGLNPKLVPLIVARAHAEGYRVTAHVETAADFRHAVNAGVDEINHTPGYYTFSKDAAARYALSKEDAHLAADKKVIVVTALLSRSLLEDQSLLPSVEKMQAQNLKLLYENGVTIAIGSDHASTPVQEVQALRKLSLFDNLTILKMWCENSAQAIFPDRKLGFLKDGYEASFVTLDGNPLDDFSSTSKIVTRCKQGHFLKIK